MSNFSRRRAVGVGGRWGSSWGRATVLAGGSVVLLVGLGGCALGPQTVGARQVQAGLTGLMLVDTLQTLQIARNPDCLREVNPLAFGGEEHPSEKEVVVHNLLYGLGHWLLSGYLDRKVVEEGVSLHDGGKLKGGKWAGRQRFYWRATLAGHGLAVGSNFAQGIRPVGSYRCSM